MVGEDGCGNLVSLPDKEMKKYKELTAADLKIMVSGKDADGNEKNVTVTCATNDDLKAFLTDLTSDDGTASGEGLWKDASIQIRGIYYNMTDAQKEVGNFRNYVSVSADAGGVIIRGADYHIVYSKLTYYQWADNSVVIDREQLYYDLLDRIVGSAEDLPAMSDMILVPSDSNGIERQDGGLSNTTGGNVYLKSNYTDPGTYVSYVTIRDQNDPTYALTVPVVMNVLETKDSTIVLDYGLDASLTNNGAIFEFELSQIAEDNVAGSVMGVAGSDIQTPSYLQYDVDRFVANAGNKDNNLTLLSGTYENQHFTGAQYSLENAIELKHSRPWVVEFKVKSMEGTAFLFSVEADDATAGNEYLFLRKDFIALGRYEASKYYNYAVATTALADTQWHEYKMYNVIASDGSNMVYLSIDGGTPTAMNNYYIGTASQGSTDNSWINGKDFTFNYLGGSNRKLTMDMQYLRIYEEGSQLTHYRWEASGTKFVSTDTGKPGYEAVTPEHYTYAYSGNTMNRWRYFNVTLNSNHPWELEFEMQIPTLSNFFMLMASTGSEVVNDTKDIFIRPDRRFISMGYCYAEGKYYSYGVLLPSDFDMTQSHTYLLKNRINEDGTNMVYLYVDKTENGVWTEVGPLNYNIDGTEVTGTGLSGMDFNFKYIGGPNQYAFKDQVISYFEVRQTIAQNNYLWTAGDTGFENVDIIHDGNRIEFTKEESGVVTDGEGKFILQDGKLTFEVSDFMDQEYTTYIAYTIHDKELDTPTSLGQPGIKVSKEVQMYKKVTFVPANVVYYEDDFKGIHYDVSVLDSGTGTGNQVQSLDQDTEYGSDSFYQNTTSDMSGGHITQIPINADGRLAWFEFTGTGFELISSTNAVDSPIIYIEVYDRDDVTITDETLTVNSGAKEIDWIPLITEFDNGNNDGEEVIHQVPLIRWQREAETAGEAATADEYVVTINGYVTYDYPENYDPTAPSIELETVTTYLYVDGVRIFQPLGYDNSKYNTLENKVFFDEIRNQILDSKLMVSEKSDAGVVINSGTTTWTENFTGVDHTGAKLVGNEVSSVNDYLLNGPNNEVYMEVTSEGSSAIAFVVYADKLYTTSELGLQIGVRAIDRGNFFGTGSTGLKANLEIGVVDANGDNCWMPLAAVTSGTEQYVTIPYELCPAITSKDAAGKDILEYHVIIRVSADSAETPSMVSFSSLKRTEGLYLKENISDAVTIEQDASGQWFVPKGDTEVIPTVLMIRRAMMAQTVISPDEAVPGENFANYDVIVENTPAIVPQYPSLSFEGEVQYNIYYTVQNLDDVALEDMGLITFDTENANGTISDAIDVIPGAVSNGSHYIVHTNGIPAKNLGDTLYFKVYAKLEDGSYLYSNINGYSAKVYAEQQLAGTNDAVKPLVVAMLNYGAAAQEFFNYNTDSLMNASFTAEQQALVTDYHSGMASEIVSADSSKVGSFVNNGGFVGAYPSVTFGGAFSINYYFTPSYALDGDMTLYFWDAETYNSVDELTAANAIGSEKMASATEAGEYFAAYTGIAAKEISDTVYVAATYTSNGVTYCSGVIAYSLSEYCKGFAEDTTSSAQKLATTTLIYGYYAENYFAG